MGGRPGWRPGTREHSPLLSHVHAAGRQAPTKATIGVGSGLGCGAEVVSGGTAVLGLLRALLLSPLSIGVEREHSRARPGGLVSTGERAGLTHKGPPSRCSRPCSTPAHHGPLASAPAPTTHFLSTH